MTHDIVQNYDLKVNNDDVLQINITCLKPDLVVPFMQGASANAASNDGEVSFNTFLVDSKGYIYFPILGKIKVAGMTNDEISSHIERLIEFGGYINDPIVTVRLQNFKIVVLGGVSSPGIKTFDSDRVSIFDAIAASGDIQNTGKKKEVVLVREIDGKRKIVELDVTEADIFNSPYYYLKQNDILYVEPNKRASRSGQLLNDDRFFSLGLTFATSLISILVGSIFF